MYPIDRQCHELTRKRIHVPKMEYGGSLLSHGFAARRRPFPLPEIMFSPSHSAYSISWMSFRAPHCCWWSTLQKSSGDRHPPSAQAENLVCTSHGRQPPRTSRTLSQTETLTKHRRDSRVCSRGGPQRRTRPCELPARTESPDSWSFSLKTCHKDAEEAAIHTRTRAERKHARGAKHAPN